MVIEVSRAGVNTVLLSISTEVFLNIGRTTV
jgi:hypothetical protein